MTVRKFSGLIVAAMCIAMVMAGTVFGSEDNTLTISADFPPVFIAGVPWQGTFTAIGVDSDDIEDSRYVQYRWRVRSYGGLKFKLQMPRGNPLILTAYGHNKMESGTATFTVMCYGKALVQETYELTVYALNFMMSSGGKTKRSSLGFTGFTGTEFSRTLQAQGLPAPITLSLEDGELPPGMSIAFSGDMVTLSGTPSKAGQYNYTIGATFSNDMKSTASFSASIYSGDRVTILNDASFTGSGRVGRKYSSSIHVVGKSVPYTYTVTSGTLPPGLELSHRFAEYYDEDEDEIVTSEQEDLITLSGIPTTEGTYNFTLRISDATGLYTDKAFSINIEPQPVGIKIDSKTFPDENFREMVIGEFSDEDDVLTAEEIAEVKEISVSGEIANIKGIEYFTALENLMVNDTQLRTLDLSGLQSLKTVDCSDNAKLSSITLGNNPALQALTCYGNSLSTLDVSGCANLVYLDCNSNKLKTLDLRANTQLRGLLCNENQLEQLIIYNCPSLGKEDELSAEWGNGLDCAGNKLTELDISGCPALFELEEDDNGNLVPMCNFSYDEETTRIIYERGIPAELVTSALPAIKTETPCSIQLEAAGNKPITFSKVSGNLPSGISLSESGVLSGTASKAGSYTFTVQASNSYGKDKKQYTLTVYAPIEIITASLKDGTIGKSYSATVKTKKSDKTLAWSAIGLPNGLSINAKTWTISGKPSVFGTFSVKITAKNSGGSATKTLPLKINEVAPKLSGSLAKAELGKPYSSGLKLPKGIGSVSWSLDGDLPEGLTFDPSTGNISGTPTSYGEKGIFKLTITATNSAGSKSKNTKLTVKGTKPTIKSKFPTSISSGQEYNVKLTATGSSPITWTADLPDFLTLDGGAIKGTVPASATTFTLTVSATNPVKTVSKTITVRVKAKKSLPENLTDSNEPETEPAVIENAPLVPENYADNSASGYILVAELGTVSSDTAGMHEFVVALADDAPEGWKLLYMAGSDDPSDDDEIAEFYDESGEEIFTVPEGREITVSVWLNPGTVYKPRIFAVSQ